MEDDTTMAQEDQTRNCNSGGGNNGNGGIGGGVGRSSKKPKQKKVPQRGLGVAQLEKIRLEEQQKKDAASILSSQCSLQSSTKSSSYLPLPIQNIHHSNQPSPLVPLVSVSPADFRLQHMVDANDPAATSTVPLANSGGFEPGWLSPRGHHGNVPKLCDSQEIDLEKEKFVVEPGLQFPSRLRFEPSLIWSLPNSVQRTPQYHRHSSSMVNVSPGTSSIPVSHFSIEPPSNQNHSGNIVPVTVRPAEKIIGMKRSYPFSLDVPPAPLFNYKLVPTLIERRTNASTLCGSGGSGSGFNFDAGNSTLREVPSCSASNSEPNSRKSNKEGENFSGDFLTLAPPTPISCPPPTPTSCPSSKFKSSSAFPAFHNQENPDFESPSSKGIIEGQVPPPPPPGYNTFNQQNQPFYCFFPPAPEEAQNGQTRAKIQNGNEVKESIDLNLKL